MPSPLSSSMMRVSARSRSLSRSAAEVPAMPALLTRTSSEPNSRSISANMALTCALSATSARIARAPDPAAPSASTVSRAAFSFRSFAMTCAPSRANSVAIARPMPEPAPVMRLTLSLSFTATVRPRPSSVEPGDHQAPAVFVAFVGAEVLDVRLPGGDGAHRGPVEPQDILGDVALDVVNDLAALGDVEGAALELDHVRELGIVDARGVERLAGDEVAVEVAVGVVPAAEETGAHLVELAEDRARDEGAVLLQLELRLDPALLPAFECHLHCVHEVRTIAGRGLDRGLEAAREAGVGQQPPGLAGIEVVEPPPFRGQLIDRERPVFEGGGDGRVGRPVPL